MKTGPALHIPRQRPACDCGYSAPAPVRQHAIRDGRAFCAPVTSTASSIRPACESPSARAGPPSQKTRVIPRAPSRRIASSRRTRPASSAPTRMTSSPAATSRRSASTGAPTVVITQLGGSPALCTSRDSSASESPLSMTTRTGERAERPGRRTSRRGSIGSDGARPHHDRIRMHAHQDAPGHWLWSR